MGAKQAQKHGLPPPAVGFTLQQGSKDHMYQDFTAVFCYNGLNYKVLKALEAG